MRPEKQSLFKVSDLNVIKLLTRLRVEFSDLCEHKFRHNFYVTPMCMYSEDTETSEHYLLCCQLCGDLCDNLFNTVSSIIQNDVSTFRENDVCLLLLYGDPGFNEISDRSSLESTIKFFTTLIVSLAACDPYMKAYLSRYNHFFQRTCQNNPLISLLLPQTGTGFAQTARTVFLTCW